MRSRRVLFLLAFAVSLALGVVLWPFHGAILWASIIALLSRPLFRWIAGRIRFSRSVAALLTMAIVFVSIVLPLVFVLATLAQEASDVFRRMQSGELDPESVFVTFVAGLPQWLAAPLHRSGLEDLAALRLRLIEWITPANHWITTQVFAFGQNTLAFVTGTCITLYLAFFLLRDGDMLMRAVSRSIPMASIDKRMLLETFTVVLRATVKGNFFVASIQGILGGIAFWFLQIPGAALWAVLLSFMSLVPAVGTGLVIAPMTLYLLITAPLWEGVFLAAYGLLVIGLVDNLLRPILVGKDTHLPDYVVLITTLGGIAAFGINGFVLGPVIAALFIAVWRMHSAGAVAASSALANRPR